MFIKALLTSLIVWMGFLDKAFLHTFIYRPICIGPIVGLIYGNLPMGLEVGAAIELMFLAVVFVGTAVPPDEVISTGIATALACSTGSVELGIATALPISLIGLVGRYFRNGVVQEFTTRQVERASSKANTTGIVIWTSLVPAIMNYVLFGIPTLIAVYYGAEYVKGFLDTIPSWLTTGVRVGGRMLGSVGVALLLGTIRDRQSWPYLLIGFILVSFFKLNMLGMAIVVVVVVALVYYSDKNRELESNVETPHIEQTEERHLSDRTLWKTYFYSLAIESGCSNTKQEAPGITQGMIPIIEEVYTEHQDKVDAYERHNQLFLTEGRMASFCIGISGALEERYAKHRDIDPHSINQIKVALMGPLAGIGDSLLHGTLRPIMAGLACSMAMASNYTSAIGSVIFFAVMAITGLTVRYFGIFKGYQSGLTLITKLQSGGVLDKITKYAGIAAALVCGGFIPALVSIKLGIAFQVGEGVMLLQDVLDSLIPNLLPLCLTMLMYYLMTKKNANMILLMIVLFVLGIVGVASGVLA